MGPTVNATWNLLYGQYLDRNVQNLPYGQTNHLDSFPIYSYIPILAIYVSLQLHLSHLTPCTHICLHCN